MKDELIVFTHNDLDALGCMLNLEYKFPTVRKRYYHTNYANINEIVDEIIQYQAQNGNTNIVIPDVSFADNKPALKLLYEAFDKCTHIDHHLYPDGFWDEFPHMKVVWDKTKCATLLCNEYLGNKGQNQNLDNLSMIIDVYDLWQVKSPYFDVAQDLNEYFWRFGTTDLTFNIIENGYKLPDNYKSAVGQFATEFEGALKSYENRNLIHRAGDITVAFVQEWFNQILVKEMREGKHFVIGINEWGIVKVRINQDTSYTGTQLDDLREILTGNRTIGHMHAFTYKVQGTVDFNAIMAEVQKVTKAINDSCF